MSENCLGDIGARPAVDEVGYKIEALDLLRLLAPGIVPLYQLADGVQLLPQGQLPGGPLIQLQTQLLLGSFWCIHADKAQWNKAGILA